MAALASSIFAMFYWLVDVQGYKPWAQPFGIYGKSAMTLYVLAGVLARTTMAIKLSNGDGSRRTLKKYLFRHLFEPLASPVNASLLHAVAFVLLFLGIARIMHRRNWIVKI
jgi:predicted acyltransferase